MFEANLWTYPWDLVDEGIDAVLDRLKGQAGVTGIAVAVSYHSVDQLRVHPGVSPRTFRSTGGLQFQPHTPAYAGSRIRPVVADWLKKSNPLKAIADACVKHGMKLRAWTVCCHGSLIVSRHPHGAVKDVFGDVYPQWLCPINPDVREYLRALIEDLRQNYPFDTIELERPTFDAAPHSHAHHKIGVPLGDVGLFLYRLCFCESCRQLAGRDGVDVDAAIRSASVTLEKILSTGEPVDQPLGEFVAADAVIEDYVDWRCRQITSLVGTLKEAAGGRVVVHRAGDRFLAAADWPGIAGQCDGLLHHAGFPDRPGSMEATVRQALDETGEMSRVELGFSACTPPCPSSEVLVSAFSQAARLGVRSVDIYNYGMLPLSRLEWIRRAIRVAQREATQG